MAEHNLKHQFAYRDLRDWIAEIDRLGEIKRLQGMSWEREIGMVSTLLQRSDPAPCAVFEDIPGVAKGFRVLTNFFGAKRANVTLGFPPGMNKVELSEAFLESLSESRQPADPAQDRRDRPDLRERHSGRQGGHHHVPRAAMA